MDASLWPFSIETCHLLYIASGMRDYPNLASFVVEVSQMAVEKSRGLNLPNRWRRGATADGPKPSLLFLFLCGISYVSIATDSNVSFVFTT